MSMNLNKIQHKILGQLEYKDILGWVGTYDLNGNDVKVYLDVEDEDIDHATNRFLEIIKRLDDINNELVKVLLPIHVRDTGDCVHDSEFISKFSLSSVSIMIDESPDEAGVILMFSTSLFGGHSAQVYVNSKNDVDVSVVG